MSELTGMQVKFTVLKNEDINKYLDEHEKNDLSRILWKVQELRLLDRKPPLNTYLVVNTDEPYATDIVRIMQANNHWGPVSDPNQAEMQFKGDTLLLPETEGNI
ncbi:hypothetical protein GMA19_03077 [Paenibacillus polymyxa E681]|uniref:hypothetical protein n=1 Tax=Paenibacillus polymyxa TaxID=1406 RepID=UPI0001E31CCF|nr:hypothetical protein [Paenibacillus polymyxa]ADM70881.1 hypothetical protein PPE_03058 [Paenibacillus polymyxa E681]QNV57906.1 hypothetical protein GE561_03077 [Paenibacillus polymyxa E681]QNV62743.1 hypothetical protein GMA19_03077 [Paenibacillus polymyxa E681]